MTCGYSAKTRLRRGEAIVCWNKERRGLEKIFIGPAYCVGTCFSNYSGHSSPDVDIDKTKIDSCPYRKPIIPEEEKQEIANAKEEERKSLRDFREAVLDGVDREELIKLEY